MDLIRASLSKRHSRQTGMARQACPGAVLFCTRRRRIRIGVTRAYGTATLPVQTPDDSPTKRSGIPSSIAACSQARFISVRGSAGAPAARRACRPARASLRCAHHLERCPWPDDPRRARGRGATGRSPLTNRYKSQTRSRTKGRRFFVMVSSDTKLTMH